MRPLRPAAALSHPIVALALALVPGLAPAAWDWSPLRIGGAGWVTGMALHPSSPDVIYARTDVGGAYRWNPGDETWTQLITVDSVPDGVPGDYDVASVAVAPSDDSVVYLAVGSDSPPGGELAPAGRVLASVDGGASFARGGRIFRIRGNAEGRQGGERLVVDPADARRVLLGTRHEGLFLSTDGARTWTGVSTLPAGDVSGNGALGVKLVVFDPATASGGTTARVYASVSGEGIFRSDDAGASWRRILGANAGTGFDAEVTARGELVVAFLDGAQLRRYDSDADAWTDISPQTRTEDRPVSLAVDPFDADRIVYARSGVTQGRLFRSTDGGASWDVLGTDVDVGEVAWRDDFATDFLSVGSFEFDPVVPGRLWFPEGFGVLRSEDLSDGAITWELFVDGIEELVGTDVVVPPGGAPVTTHLDAPIFRHPTPGGDAFDAIVGPTKRFNSGYDVSYAPSRPSRLAAVVQDQRLECCFDGLKNQSGLSDDGGRTWRPFGSLANGTHPADLIFGNIEIGSDDPDNIVWLPSFDAPVRWSSDGGDSWNVASIPGTSVGSHQANFLDREVLVADPVAPATFYLHHDDLGTVRSADGGRNWEVLGFGPIIPFARFNSTMKAAPGRVGDLWFTPGRLDNFTSPLYRSTDGGERWAVVERLTNVEAIGFGAIIDDYPEIYLAGELDGVRALWRSIDAGASWEDIGFPFGVYDDVAAIDGSPDAPGTVYVNISGVGAAVGRGAAGPPANGTCDVTLAANRTRLESNRWTMLALPCAPPASADTVAAVLGDDVERADGSSGVYGTDWTVFTYDAATRDYVDPGASGRLRPGTGFWMITKGPAATLDLPPGSTRARDALGPGGPCTSGDGCAVTPLAASGSSRPTWTMIGNPLPAPTRVPFDGLRFVTSGGACGGVGCTFAEATDAGLAAGPGFFRFGAGEYLPLITSGDTLSAWEGYWAATSAPAAGLGPRVAWPR